MLRLTFVGYIVAMSDGTRGIDDPRDLILNLVGWMILTISMSHGVMILATQFLDNTMLMT